MVMKEHSSNNVQVAHNTGKQDITGFGYTEKYLLLVILVLLVVKRRKTE